MLKNKKDARKLTPKYKKNARKVTLKNFDRIILIWGLLWQGVNVTLNHVIVSSLSKLATLKNKKDAWKVMLRNKKDVRKFTSKKKKEARKVTLKDFCGTILILGLLWQGVSVTLNH